jgi:hypothetical protein
MKRLPSVTTWLERGQAAICLDPRSLGLFRIAAGIFLLYWFAVQWPDLEAFYSEKGLLPATAAREGPCLHAWNGSLLWQQILTGAGAAAAGALAVGYRPQLAAFACWLLIVSAGARNPFLQGFGDHLLKCALLWLALLPSGSVFSPFAHKPARPIRSLAAAGYFFQIALLYLMAGTSKDFAEWCGEKTALFYALTFDVAVRPLGRWLLQFPQLLEGISFLMPFWQGVTGLLLLASLFWKRCRMAALALAAGFHIGAALCLQLGFFPLVGLMTLLPLLPPELWKSRPTAPPTPPETWHLPRILALVLLVLMGGYMAGARFSFPLPAWFRSTAAFLQFEQDWDMYSKPSEDRDGWYILDGETVQGNRYRLGAPLLDLEGTDELNWQKPASENRFKNAFWSHYFYALSAPWNRERASHLGPFILRKWNQQHPEAALTRLAIYFIPETAKPGAGEESQPPILLYQYAAP